MSALRVPPHERLVLDNGARLLILPRRDVPLIACTALLSGGALGDPRGKSGVAALTAGLLDKGAGALDARGFADAVEGAGGSLSGAAAPELIALTGQFLARDQALLLELLRAALTEPRFDAEELEKLRARYCELIKAAKDTDPGELIGAYGRALLFRSHPYARPVLGSERSLEAIGRADLQSYHREQLGGNRLVLAFAGDVNVARLKRAVRRMLAGWRRARAPLRPLTPPAQCRRRAVLLVDAPGAEQTHFWIGGVGVARSYAHRAALDLVNSLYGGSFGSILNTELRVKAGLTYAASSSFTRGRVPAEFAIRSFTRTADTGRALELTLATLARLKRGAITQAALESARAYLLGQYPLSLETAGDWSHALGELEVYGLSPAYIDEYPAQLRRVSLAEARRVAAAAFPDPARVAIVAIGDAARIRRPLERLGPVRELPLAHGAFR